MTHLGLSELAATQTITPLPNGTFQLSATATYTAANGDVLRVSIQGLATPTGPTTVALSGTQTVTGGTGRFAGASGGSTLAGSAMFTGPGSGVGTFTASGSIAY